MMQPSKAVQLSAVLTLSAIVSGCVPNVIAAPDVVPELASLGAESPDIARRKDFPGEDYYQDQQRFFDSDFDYDDAAMLATYWGESIDDSKARIGDKLTATNGVEIVNDILLEAERAINSPGFTPLTRTGPEDPDRQAYIESDYAYEDAELLAAFWGIPIDDAKAHIGRVLRGDEGADVVDEMLEAAQQVAASENQAYYEGSEFGVATPTVQESRQAYFSSDYSYDDAEALAAAWGADIDEAKTRIGRKLILNGSDFVDEMLQDARQASIEDGIDEVNNASLGDATYHRERQAYFDSDYSYNDAMLLADFWGMDIDETKARMGRKILWGEDDIQILNDYLQEAEAFATQG